jgi:thiamine biosynthesis lipoprotein ApbE
MAVGFEAAKLLSEREDLEVILVTPDKQVWRRAKAK